VPVSEAVLRLPISAASYAAAIEGLVRLDEHIIAGRDFKPLYESGVRYKREPRDVWRNIDDVYKSGWGDCEDLAAIRSAQLRATGEDPAAKVAIYQSGPKRYHAIVARGDGSTEDPSKRLGMKPGGRSPMGTLEGDTMKETKAERRARGRAIARHCVENMQRQSLGGGAWIGLGEDPMPQDKSISFDLYRSGRGWSGIVRFPLRGTGAALVAKTTASQGKAQAAKKTLNLASKISKIPGVHALVPPQAQAALTVLKSPIGKMAVKPFAKLF
jgi:hypothetical protein